MTILVAYDGSAPAQQAAEYAFTTHTDDEIILLRVVEAADGSTGASINYAQDLLTEEEDTAADTLREEAAELANSENVQFTTETAVGRPDREIVSFAVENDVDQIVVGSHGRSGVSRVLLGSVAERIARRAPMPVTIVR